MLKRMSNNNRLLVVIVGSGVAVLVALLWLSVISVQSGIDRNNRETKYNQGLQRYMACVTDVRNSAEKVAIGSEANELCWKIAEDQTGQDLPRYVDLILNQQNQ